ncbi:MAG: hypothetical protein IJ631_00325 [Schwartzia sp.]|nr:hypothetical protein [Schwartzia sp. (in: firmicutes)]
MKALAIGVLATALFGAFAGTPVCFAADADIDIEDGGTVDHSARHVSPVVIASRALSSFRLRFEFGDPHWDDGLHVKYPPGRYDLRLEKIEGGATCHLEYWTEGGPARKADFPVKGDALARLDALLKEHDVAQIDGHAKYNSALGSDMDLEALYESGESIHACGQGGADVTPDARYYREEWFIDFFRALGHEYGQGDLLGPPLARCSYRESGGMEGRFYELELSAQKDGSAHLSVDFLPRNGAESLWREYDLPKAKMDELEAMLDRGSLADWGKAPMSEVQALDADTAYIVFGYADGREVSLADNRALPKEAFAAMRKVREFLEALDTDAPKK